jgi:uncharacterized protein (TIGR03437 family)
MGIKNPYPYYQQDAKFMADGSVVFAVGGVTDVAQIWKADVVTPKPPPTPLPTITSVVNWASRFAPCAAGICTIWGSDLTAGGSANFTTVPLPTILAGSMVFVNGVAAPLYGVTPSQINFQMPAATPTNAPVPFTVTTPNGTTTIKLAVPDQAPAIYQINGVAVAQANGNPDRVDTIAPGSWVTFYGTGFGKSSTCNIADGELNPLMACPSDMAITLQLTGVVNMDLQCSYTGRAPGYVGLDQANCKVPDVPGFDPTHPSGDPVPVFVSVSAGGNSDTTAQIKLQQ